jgi:hypothetical protein
LVSSSSSRLPSGPIGLDDIRQNGFQYSSFFRKHHMNPSGQSAERGS